MELTVLLLLILLNGVFALSEMAVVSSRKVRLLQWADDGRSGAALAFELANHPGHFLSTIQIGITLIGILSGAVGEATIARSLAEQLSVVTPLRAYADSLSFGIVVTGITLLSLVLGELVPKRLALLNPEAIASAIAGPMRLLSRVAFPLVHGLNLFTEFVLRLLAARAPQPPPVTEEEINVLMEQGAEAGVFEKHEQALVSRVFRIGEQRITSAMTPRIDIVYFDVNDPFEVNRDKLLRSTHSRFPVCRGHLDEVVGVLQAKTLLDDMLLGKPVDLMSGVSRAFYVPDSLTVVGLLEAFKKHRQQFALVIDEYGELHGLVTMNDVVGTLVGDIATVQEVAEPEVVQRDDGSWLIDGNVTAERFREMMALPEPLPGEATESYHTLAGFAMRQLGRIPQAGDRFENDGFRFEIVDMDKNRVDKLLVMRLDEGAPSGSPLRRAGDRSRPHGSPFRR
jgi:putative hemolysin